MKPPTNTTALPVETLGQPAQRSYEKGDPMAIAIPPPVAAQCPSTIRDRATDEETRCILPIGHEGRHDDGCMTWTWGDVRPIFGTVTAAEPLRFIQGALPTDHEADARAGRALEAHYAAWPKRKVADKSPPKAEECRKERALPLVLTPAHIRAMVAAGWRAGEENPAAWLVERLSDVSAALQLITGPQGITLLFEGLVLKQLHRHPDDEKIRIHELSAYLREFVEVFGVLTTDDFRRKPEGAISTWRIGGQYGDWWCAWVIDEGKGCTWGFGVRENRLHQTAHPVASVEDGQRAAVAMAHRVAAEARAILRALGGEE